MTEMLCEDAYIERVKIKGNSGLYSLAIWQVKGYAYSISTVNGVDEVTLQKVMESVK